MRKSRQVIIGYWERQSSFPFVIKFDGIHHLLAGWDDECAGNVPGERRRFLADRDAMTIGGLKLERDGVVPPTIPSKERPLGILGDISEKDVENVASVRRH